jgi:hypothetical protein
VDPPPPGFDRLSLSCRACRGVDVLDVPQGVMTPARLSNLWARCSECGSPDIQITLRATGATRRAA